MMRRTILKMFVVCICHAVFFYSNTAFGGAYDQLKGISGGGSGNSPDVGPPERGGIIDFLPPPDFPLLEAVKKGDIKKVKSILEAQEAYKRGQAFQDLKAEIAARQGCRTSHCTGLRDSRRFAASPQSQSVPPLCSLSTHNPQFLDMIPSED